MAKNKAVGPLYCISAALIWGMSFVAQKAGASVGTFTFNGIRLLIGGISLIPAVIVSYRKSRLLPPDLNSPDMFDKKSVFSGGLVCGIALFSGTTLQQHAFTYNLEAGKVAFITALYMILVPIFGLFMKKKAGLNLWFGVLLGITGLYLICITGGSVFSAGKGELCALACAFCFAAHIHSVDHFCTKVNNVTLSCLQFLFAGIVSLVCMLVFERPFDLSAVLSMAVPILYAGLGSCTLGFTFQIFGQKTTEPALASLLMCFESVFAAIFGWLILKDHLTSRVLIGCAVMFAGVVVTQIPVSRLCKNSSEGEKADGI